MSRGRRPRTPPATGSTGCQASLRSLNCSGSTPELLSGVSRRLRVYTRPGPSGADTAGNNGHGRTVRRDYSIGQKIRSWGEPLEAGLARFTSLNRPHQPQSRALFDMSLPDLFANPFQFGTYRLLLG